VELLMLVGCEFRVVEERHWEGIGQHFMLRESLSRTTLCESQFRNGLRFPSRFQYGLLLLTLMMPKSNTNRKFLLQNMPFTYSQSYSPQSQFLSAINTSLKLPFITRRYSMNTVN
jgi:hypothetical protein